MPLKWSLPPTPHFFCAITDCVFLDYIPTPPKVSYNEALAMIQLCVWKWVPLYSDEGHFIIDILHKSGFMIEMFYLEVFLITWTYKISFVRYSLAYYTDHVLQWNLAGAGLILGPLTCSWGCSLRRGGKEKLGVGAIQAGSCLIKSKSKAVFCSRLWTTLCM